MDMTNTLAALRNVLDAVQSDIGAVAEQKAKEYVREKVEEVDWEDLAEKGLSNIDLEDVVERSVDAERIVEREAENLDWSNYIDVGDIAREVKGEIEDDLEEMARGASRDEANDIVNDKCAHLETQIADVEQGAKERHKQLDQNFGQAIHLLHERQDELKERIVSVENQLLLATKTTPDLKAQFLALATAINRAFGPALPTHCPRCASERGVAIPRAGTCPHQEA